MNETETVRQRLAALRNSMKEHGIDWYLVPSSDYHNSEYAADFFKARAYLSGFTGSTGTLLVGMYAAKLWTDGRYFVQAAAQLAAARAPGPGHEPRPGPPCAGRARQRR